MVGMNAYAAVELQDGIPTTIHVVYTKEEAAEIAADWADPEDEDEDYDREDIIRRLTSGDTIEDGSWSYSILRTTLHPLPAPDSEGVCEV